MKPEVSVGSDDRLHVFEKLPSYAGTNLFIILPICLLNVENINNLKFNPKPF